MNLFCDPLSIRKTRNDIDSSYHFHPGGCFLGSHERVQTTQLRAQVVHHPSSCEHASSGSVHHIRVSRNLVGAEIAKSSISPPEFSSSDAPPTICSTRTYNLSSFFLYPPLCPSTSCWVSHNPRRHSLSRIFWPLEQLSMAPRPSSLLFPLADVPDGHYVFLTSTPELVRTICSLSPLSVQSISVSTKLTALPQLAILSSVRSLFRCSMANVSADLWQSLNLGRIKKSVFCNFPAARSQANTPGRLTKLRSRKITDSTTLTPDPRDLPDVNGLTLVG